MNAVLEPVRRCLRDLSSTGEAVPTASPYDGGVDGQHFAELRWPTGRAFVVHADVSDDEEGRIADVAGQVQDGVVDVDGTAWPPCPLHPDTHPLDARRLSGFAQWVCPRDDQPIARVGDL